MGVSSMLESLMLTQEGSLMASSFRAVTRQVRWCEDHLLQAFYVRSEMLWANVRLVVQLLRHYTAGSNINIHTRRGTQRGRAMRRGGTRGRGTRRRAPSRSLLPPHASEPHDPVPSPDPNQYPPQHLPQHQYPTQYPPQQRPISPFQGRDMFCNPPNFS
ncbi:hypothetical protein J6590_105761 [Homalodisca vitripennis]|nr:hypothetical protein J6590_105761 [Homalodisca vitripennis]